MECAVSASSKTDTQGMPPGTPTKRIAHEANAGEFTDYVVGGSLITHSSRLATWVALPVHVMASRASSPRQPDWVCV